MYKNQGLEREVPGRGLDERNNMNFHDFVPTRVAVRLNQLQFAESFVDALSPELSLHFGSGTPSTLPGASHGDTNLFNLSHLLTPLKE